MGDTERIELVAKLPPDTAIDRVRAFEIACGRKSGLRLAREEREVAISIHPARIERLGPVVEAAATVTGARLMLRHPVGELAVPVGSSLDNRPLGLWAAIGDAVDEDAVERSRGHPADGDLFRHVRADKIDGVPTAVDARPPRAEPVSGIPYDSPVKYDDVDYHEGPAEEAGQPPEHAFTHIGLFLAWAIRRDLHEPQWFPEEHTAAVKSGSWTGSDVADDIDGKLLSDMFTEEGAAFADAHYRDYLAAFGETFADLPDYGVPDDEASRRRIEPILDDMYRAWMDAGRPPADSSETIDIDASGLPSITDIPWDEIPGGHDVVVSSDGGWEFVRKTPHQAPDLELLVPSELLDDRARLMSTSPSHWGSSVLNRALRDLQVGSKDAAIASAITGSGEGTLTITIYRIPGIPADRLFERFASVIVHPGRAKWQERIVDDRPVNWAEGSLAPGEARITIAYWARDGYVFHAAGPREDVETAIRSVGADLDS